MVGRKIRLIPQYISVTLDKRIWDCLRYFVGGKRRRRYTNWGMKRPIKAIRKSEAGVSNSQLRLMQTMKREPA